MNEKFLLFQNAANDCMMYPLKSLKSVEAGAGVLNFLFETAVSGDDELTVSCGTDEHQAMIDLAEFLGGPAHSDGVYVIADDVNSVYAVDGFTAVGATS
tara:strand:+ start:268 stop:564 length:297 start_codon:yes stop_codon:yes gene_type:complete